RVVRLNRIVERGLTSGDGIWASGGDGGHLALLRPSIDLVVQILTDLEEWSARDEVQLRRSLHAGVLRVLEGADNRTQMVGATINTAGWLVEAAPQGRTVASDAFCQWAARANGPGGALAFSETPRLVYPKHHASPEAIFLVAMNSEPPIWDDVTIDDRGRL